DADRELAAEKYEDLRRVLIRFFEWRGAPFPEEHADEAFNRVARKLGEGIEIKNIGGYCYEVARLILHETFKSPERRHDSLDAATLELPVSMPGDDLEEKEMRLSCLDDCLATLPDDGRDLIIEYYRDVVHVDHRRALAARLGVRREALANRAQRLR